MRSMLFTLSSCLAVSSFAQIPEANGLRPSPIEPSISRPVLTPETRGDIYMARKMFREAADVYRESPESHILANKIGIAYHQMMALPQAKRQYERAVKLRPDYSEAINNLGTIYYAQQNYRKAIKPYQRALKSNPNSASIYSNLGTAWFARKKYNNAFEAYQKALSIDPEVFEHRSTQGVLLQERSITERAKFHYYLAKTYAKSGDTERTLMYMRKALEEGFKERGKFLEDPEFSKLQANPEFQALLKLEARVL